jgi:nucleotidyltransferase substrate binding protein (TIGR01987 family)
LKESLVNARLSYFNNPMNKPNLENYKKALKTLDDAMVSPPASELERDGMIQRFKYCLEISWNSAKKILEFQGYKVDTPRNIFRELARIGWINNPDEWIEFLESRNKTSHMYHEEIANELFGIIPSFLKASHDLLNVLEDNLK